MAPQEKQKIRVEDLELMVSHQILALQNTVKSICDGLVQVTNELQTLKAENDKKAKDK